MRDVLQGDENVLLLGIVSMMLAVAIALLFLPPLLRHKYVCAGVAPCACAVRDFPVLCRRLGSVTR